MSVTVFTMTHKKFPMPKDGVYVPLHVGRACGEDLGYMGDDTGVSISDKNCFYGELTGVYWVWKNIRTSGYVGVCHYRRYFCTEEGRILNGAEYEKILSEYDLITSKKLKLNYSYFDGYASDYNIMDLIAVGEVIRQHYPEYYDAFERLVHGKGTYFGNMMVCSKALYDAYCQWLFGIFEKAESRIDAADYDDYHKRVYGFISEFLLMVWAEVNGLKVYECKVGMTDEKRETAEIKERLAGYFAKKDIAGAKTYILACLKKRPDVLMEASDITGELKLSMQVIAVCELEQQEYGSSVIDRIQDFRQLMRYFQKINEAVNAFRTEGMSDASAQEAEAFLPDVSVSDVALEASARLFCSCEEAKAVAYKIRNGLNCHKNSNTRREDTDDGEWQFVSKDFIW
ncbi:MAG: DUF4422 domain-containing protein [Lachnospiraceae bacterium]|nr:DUF4422 domain-containing protein [Lachnospiraceae bacterium]